MTGWFVQIITPGVGGIASWDVLRRRTYLRAFPLPRGRAVVIGRLPL